VSSTYNPGSARSMRVCIQPSPSQRYGPFGGLREGKLRAIVLPRQILRRISWKIHV